MEHAVLLADTHLPFQHRAAVEVVWEYQRRTKPSVSVHLGDLVDFQMFSRHTRRKIDRQTLADLKRDVDSFFGGWRRSAKKARLYLLEGNHDGHGERWIANTNDALEGEFSVPALFHPEKYDIQWLTTEDQRDFDIGGVNLHHGSFCGVGHVRQHLTNNPTHQAYGHVHKGGTGIGRALRERNKYRVMSVPCLCEVPFWHRGRPDDWELGFGEIWWDDRGFTMHHHHIEDGRAVVAGRVYGRRSDGGPT